MFKEENTVEVVPTKWIINNQCYWPPFSREKLISSIKKNDVPNTCWPLYEIKLFRNNTFSDYAVARSKTRKAECTSDLNSDSDVKKISKRKIRKKEVSSSEISDSSDEDGAVALSRLPIPPQLCKDLVDPVINYTCCPLHPGIQGSYDLLKEIIRKQNINHQFLKQMSDDLQDLRLKIENSSEGICGNEKSVFNICDFPINKEEDVCLLKEYLSVQDNFNNAVREVSKLGGKFLYQFIQRSLSSFISNEMASKYSWLGKKLKNPFQNLKLAKLLIRK